MAAAKPAAANAESRRTTLPSGKRWYDWNGERYWSATTLLKALAKPALIPWAANETAAFALDNLDMLQALIAKGERDAAYDVLKRSPWRKRDKAADIGTAVHNAIEAQVLGKPMPAWPLPIRPRMECFQAFLEQYEPEFLMAEAPVFNRTHRYAGTLDGIIVIGGRTLVLDAKSGGKAIYAETALQLSSYRHAEFVGLPDGSEQPMPVTDGAVALHLPESGDWQLLEVQTDEPVFRAFLYVAEAFRFQEEIAKGVIGGPVRRPSETTQEMLDLAKEMA